MEKTNPSVLYMNLWRRKKGQTPTGRCKAEFSGSEQLGMEDDIINLISVQDGSGSADMQNVFGMVSYLTGWSPILKQTLWE